MSDIELIKQFGGLLEGMLGKACWSVQVSGVGSLANLHIGEKRERSQPMLHQNFQIDMEERAYQGEYILYLEECPWRLDGPDRVLASWMDESETPGRIATNLPLLKGKRVEKVNLLQPGLDLSIHFSRGMVLRVFPDQVDAEIGDNYSVGIMDKTYVVAAASTLYVV